MLNIGLIRFISTGLTGWSKRQRFIKFARLAALGSVMLGSMALIISLSVLEGFDSALKEKAVTFTSHITVSSFLRSSFHGYQATKDRLKSNFSEIKSVSVYNEREGLVRSNNFIDGVLIRGIDPKMDITNLRKNIITGNFAFTSDSSLEVIVGKRLAGKLGAAVGDNIVLYALPGQGNASIIDPKIDKFKIVGIYETGMAKYDDILVYIPLKTSSSFFRIPQGNITNYEIMLYNAYDAPVINKKIEEFLGYPYYCLTVFDLHRSIFSWIELQKEPIPLVLGLISIVAVLNIITTLLITVVEKTHSIGLLRTLGMNNRHILSVFLLQGLTLGGVGSLLGAGLGFTACKLQEVFHIIRLNGDIYFLDTLPVKLSASHFELVIGISLLLSLIATLIPSLVSLKITPLRAIRFK